MADEKSYIPAGEPPVSPYLCIRGAAEAIDFYVEVFGATESGERFVDPEGKVGHAELDLAGGRIYLADEYPGYGISPLDLPDTPVALYIYVPNVDAVVAKAEARGATVLEAPKETFYGARRATLRDPFGHRWMVVTHLHEVSSDEYKEARDDFAEHGIKDEN
jgi:PhnB protein